MRLLPFPAATTASLLFAFTGIQSLPAQLGTLNEPPWLGYFAAYSNRDYQIGISTFGKIRLSAIDSKGKPLSNKLDVAISVAIEETLPDGRIVVKEIKTESLESEQKPTDEFQKTIITGKVTGDAPFELIMEQDRGIVSLGGRLVGPGSLTNPLRFTIRVNFTEPYPFEDVDMTDKKEAKDFEKKIKADRIDLKWTDQKRVKLGLEDPVDAKSAEFNGPGIAVAEIEIGSYKGHKFIIAASDHSTMTIANAKPEPLYKGFFLSWVPDSAKDPEMKARLRIQVK